MSLGAIWGWTLTRLALPGVLTALWVLEGLGLTGDWPWT